MESVLYFGQYCYFDYIKLLHSRTKEYISISLYFFKVSFSNDLHVSVSHLFC